MAESYSPLRYPGGKAKLADFLIEVLRANGLREPEYVEPYAGGAGAALRLLCEEYVESITINDADPRIRCLWEALTQHNDAFLGMLDDVEVTVEEWRRQREVYLACCVDEVVQLGFATFFLNRTTRSGIVHNGGPIGGYDQQGNFKIDARFSRAELARRIRRIGVYADRIDVSGMDGLALLQQIDADEGRAVRAFVYLDPPYYAKGAELYLNRFTHAQHAELAAYLTDRRRFRWLLTYDNVSEVRELYRPLSQLAFSLSYSAYDRRTGEELLIHSEELQVPQSALGALPVVAA